LLKGENRRRFVLQLDRSDTSDMISAVIVVCSAQEAAQEERLEKGEGF
jgi:hypothetical protein